MTFRNHPRCTAKAKRTGKQCQNPAVTGWNVCRHHGAGAGRPIETGRYSKYAPQTIADKIDAFRLESAVDPIEELATQRALFADYLNRYRESGKPTQLDIDRMMVWLDTIGRMVKRVVDLRNESALTAAEITLIQARIVEVVVQYIDDPERRKAFIADLFSATKPDSIAELPRRSVRAT